MERMSLSHPGKCCGRAVQTDRGWAYLRTRKEASGAGTLSKGEDVYGETRTGRSQVIQRFVARAGSSCLKVEKNTME